MKKQDIVLGQEYAVYSSGYRYGRADKARITEESYNKPLNRYSEKGKIWAEVWTMSGWGADRTWGWELRTIPLNQIQEPYADYELKMAELEARLLREREENNRIREENSRRQGELSDWLRDHASELEAAGFPKPVYGYGWASHAGEVKLSFTKEQLEALLAKMMVTA